MYVNFVNVSVNGFPQDHIIFSVVDFLMDRNIFNTKHFGGRTIIERDFTDENICFIRTNASRTVVYPIFCSLTSARLIDSPVTDVVHEFPFCVAETCIKCPFCVSTLSYVMILPYLLFCLREIYKNAVYF